MYRLRIVDSAVRDIESLDRSVAKRIRRRLGWLVENFETIRPEALTAELAGLYKLRVGDYRVVYEALREEQLLVIHAIGHRREVYRPR
ncbi:MAG: type II toxin-antitoxin system RelE/ParE family toxin [Thermoanaerobaculia bacterium]|nr:type II toxin-antitoxin system RelE/ParE family toxin [Thermoanaerobaculia bacterium]